MMDKRNITQFKYQIYFNDRISVPKFANILKQGINNNIPLNTNISLIKPYYKWIKKQINTYSGYIPNYNNIKTKGKNKFTDNQHNLLNAINKYLNNYFSGQSKIWYFSYYQYFLRYYLTNMRVSKYKKLPLSINNSLLISIKAKGPLLIFIKVKSPLLTLIKAKRPLLIFIKAISLSIILYLSSISEIRLLFLSGSQGLQLSLESITAASILAMLPPFSSTNSKISYPSFNALIMCII